MGKFCPPKKLPLEKVVKYDPLRNYHSKLIDDFQFILKNFNFKIEIAKKNKSYFTIFFSENFCKIKKKKRLLLLKIQRSIKFDSMAYKNDKK